MTQRKSRLAHTRGIMFAADLTDEAAIYRCLDEIAPEIKAIKLGSLALFRYGFALVKNLKSRYMLPVVADLKLTDVAHVGVPTVRAFADVGADAVVVNGICGKSVLEDIVRYTPETCEIWVFSEFTHDDGLIDAVMADKLIADAIASGVTGVQAPGTRIHRIEDIRHDVGSDISIMACGMGRQGGVFSYAIKAGANYEIVGRAIFEATDPAAAAHKARLAIELIAAQGLSSAIING